MGTKEMYVSVIIPVYNDGERLKKCLTALAQQTYPQKNFEIIVVDNDSDDDIKAICKSFRVKYLKEVKKGSASSRNKGLNFAKGDIIASTDSDCIPDKNWLRNAVDFFKTNKDIDLIGGKVKLFSNNKEYSEADLYEFLFSFPQKNYVEKDGFSVTATLIFRRRVFEAGVKYNENIYSGCDVDICRRARAKDFKIKYVPEVVVWHPTLDSIAKLVRKARRVFAGMLFSNRKMAIISLTVSPWLHILKVIINKKFSLTQKIKVIKLVVILYFAKVKELFRLAFGKEAERQ